jgi:hypothetical protein
LIEKYLKYASTKKLLTYYEVKYQMIYQVLEKPDEYFNDNILGKFFTKDFIDSEFEDLFEETSNSFVYYHLW